MAERTREVGIRLSVKDAEIAKRALAAFGADGEAALKRIERSGHPASASLNVLSNSIAKSKAFASEFAVEAARSFLGPVLAIGTAIGAIDAMRDSIERVKKVAEFVDLADRLGIAVDKLQGLRATFRESGNDVGQLDAALQTFAANLAKSGGPLDKVFNLNKVKITGDTFTDLQHYADLVKNAKNEQEKLQLVTLAFGRSSKEVTDLVDRGGAALGRAADEAHRLNVALSEADAEKAREVQERLAEVGIKLDAAKDKFALMISPAVIGTLETFTDLLEQTRNLLTDIQNLDLQGIAKIIGRQTEGDHPSLFGKNGMFAIDWWGDGSAVTGNNDLIKAPKVNRSGGPDDRGGGWGNNVDQYLKTTDEKTKTTLLLNDALDQQTKRIGEVKDALNRQLAALGMTDREQAIANELAKAHVTAMDDEGRKIAELTGKLYDQKAAQDAVNDATAFFAQTAEGVFEDLLDGTKSWQDMLGDVTKMLEKATLQAALLGTGPLAGLFGTKADTAGETGGIFGWLASIITGDGGATGSAWTGGWGSTGIANAKGNAFADAPGLHAYVNQVATHPTVFRFAHGVGLMGEEAGSHGEGILPLMRDGRGRLGVSAMGGGQAPVVNISVVNNAGAEVTTTKRQNANGGLDIELLIERVAARSMASPGRPVNKAARTMFGLQTQLTGR
ncbi:MAG: phage tail tape measure protein [Devosia nanyangense]|uniref:Phage tail tape measure protein n=1 Tax=Devosia nanyangense TaxID=1228055 RepID=A0A933L2I8_9HYPH|nr:phage tail tape measure protein [Devosia nanyangense]